MKRRIFFSLFSLILSISMLMAQSSTVTGIVKSIEDGEPIIGASILVKGTSVGTITNMEGKFAISQVSAKSKVLVVSYVGMKTMEVSIKPGEMLIEMKPDAQALDEVVVTAQGLSRKQKSLGYSTQQVKAEDLTVARQTDLGNAMAGKIAGARFFGASGATFDAGSIVLRGTTSISECSGSEPIYVVDGVITNANSINMDDVSSINVLKGPAATAMYGSRGGNGAVIITSKGLKAGEAKTQIDISHTIQWETPKIYADLQTEYGGGSLGANGELSVFHYNPETMDPSYSIFDGKSYYDYAHDESWGPKFNGQEYLPAVAWDPTSPYYGKTTKWENGLDLGDLFRNGLSNVTNVAFARSGKDHSTRVSYSHTSRKGVQPNSDATRHFLTFKTMFKPADFITVSLDYKYTYRKNHNAATEGYGGSQNALYSYLQWGHTNVDLDMYRDYERPDGTYRAWNITSPTNLTAKYHNNPYTIYDKQNYTKLYQWNVFSGDVAVDLPFDLKAGFRVNGNIRNYKYEENIGMNMIKSTPYFEEEQNTLLDITVQGRLTWGGRYLDDRLAIDAAAFIEGRSYKYDETKAFTRDGLILDGFWTTNASVGLAGGATTRTYYKEQSIFGTGTVGWDDTYYVDFSVRNDWTSTLHPDNNSMLYGGVSIAAIASNWFKSATWLDFWKLRASAAQVGSSVDAYNIYTSYLMTDSDDNQIKYNGMSTMYASSNQKNKDLKPTISTSFEIGTEFRMFNGRLYGDINFYNRDSKNQIINVTTAPQSGYSTRKMNAGLIRNRGYEVSLGGYPVRTKNFDWELNFNISKNENTLVELVDGVDSYRLASYGLSSYIYSYAEVGKPVGVFRGTAWVRDEKGNLILKKQTGSAAEKYGDYVPQLDTSGKTDLGNFQPDFTGGFSTGFRYKNFRLNATFDFVVGGQIASITNMNGEGSGLFATTAGKNDKGVDLRSPVSEGGGVRVDGVDTEGNPVTAYVEAQQYFKLKHKIWEPYMYDRTYVKMREVSLSYDVPSSFLKKTKTGVNRLGISVFAQNPWLLYSACPNIDVSESGTNWREGGQAVATRSWGLTVNLSF